MKDQKRTDIKVGLTVVVAIALLLFIFGWAKNYNLYSNQKSVTIEFSTVNGLEKGDPVTVNGVRKGFVDQIELKNNSAMVHAIIDPDVTLKEDATFGVSMLDLMGGKKVEITPGLSEKPLNYTALQKGVFYADIPAVMAMLGSVQNDLVSIIKEVQITLSSMNKLLGDKNFNNDLRASVSNLAQISSKMNVLIDENRANIRQLAANGVQLTKEATSFMQDNKDKIKTALEEANKVLNSTNDLIARLTKIADETTNKQNNIGKLLYDDQLLSDVKASLQQVKDLTKILLEQLKGKGLNVDAKIDLF